MILDMRKYRDVALSLKPERKADLDAWRCPEPACPCGNDGMIHVQACHNASAIATYYRSTGRLVLACAICFQPYAAFQVSDDFDQVH